MKKTVIFLMFLMVILMILISCTGKSGTDLPVKQEPILTFLCCGSFDLHHGPSLTQLNTIYAHSDIYTEWIINPAIPRAVYDIKMTLKKNGFNIAEFTPPGTSGEFEISRRYISAVATYTVSIAINEKTTSRTFTSSYTFTTVKPEAFQKDTLWEFKIDKKRDTTSPKLFEGTLYFITQDTFYALDPVTGKELWNVHYDDKYDWFSMYPVFDSTRKRAFFAMRDKVYGIDLIQKKIFFKTEINGSNSANAPTLYRDELFIPTQSSGVYVIDPDTGNIKREYYISGEFFGYGYLKIAVRPCFEGNVMYLPTNDCILAIDITRGIDPSQNSGYHQIINVSTEPGVKLWRYPKKEYIPGTTDYYVTHTSSGIPLIEGEFLYCSGEYYTYKINKITGELIWDARLGQDGGPVLYKNTIICGSRRPGLIDGSRALDKETGNVIWYNDLKATPGGPFRLYKNRVYVSNGLWNCVDPDTGKLYWYLKAGYPNNDVMEIDEETDIGFIKIEDKNYNLVIAAVKLDDK